MTPVVCIIGLLALAYVLDRALWLKRKCREADELYAAARVFD